MTLVERLWEKSLRPAEVSDISAADREPDLASEVYRASPSWSATERARSTAFRSWMVSLLKMGLILVFVLAVVDDLDSAAIEKR